jgi:hypothetical protein
MPFVDENDVIGGRTRPVVVFIECNHEVFKELGGSSLFNKQIYGAHAHFNRVPDPGPHGAYHREWCLDPEDPRNMLRLLADHPKFTLPRLRKWLASDSFVRSARQTLAQTMSEAGGGGSIGSRRKFNKAWAERVRLVVFGPHIDVDSVYVKRVFQDWFPNAQFAQNNGERKEFGRSFQTFKRDIWTYQDVITPTSPPVEPFSGWSGGEGGDEEEE